MYICLILLSLSFCFYLLYTYVALGYYIMLQYIYNFCDVAINYYCGIDTCAVTMPKFSLLLGFTIATDYVYFIIYCKRSNFCHNCSVAKVLQPLIKTPPAIWGSRWIQSICPGQSDGLN